MSNNQPDSDFKTHLENLPDFDMGPSAEMLEAMNEELTGVHNSQAIVEESQGPGAETSQDDELQQAQAKNEEESDDSQTSSSFVDIDGEQIPVDEAKKLLSMGRDATKKWQEASEMRKSAETLMEQYTWVQDMQRAWLSGPEGQRQVIDILAAEAGYTPAVGNAQAPGNNQAPGTSSTKLEDYGLSDSDLSDEGRALFQIVKNLEAQNAHLMGQNQALTKTLKTFESYVEDQRADSSTQQIAAQIRAEFGAEVTSAQLRQLVKDTGINDPYAAWLKSNARNLFKNSGAPASNNNKAQGNQQGSGRTQQPKPNAPGGHGKTFNPNDYTPDQTLRMLIKGYQPVE